MNTSKLLAAFLVGAVLCYFIVPLALVVPLVLVFGKNVPDSLRDAMRMLFTPIRHLGEKFPAYGRYLRQQEDLVRKLGG